MISIRTALKEDMAQVLTLIKELADFENELEAVEVTQEDLQNDGFGPQPKFHCFLAEEGDEIIGIALVYDRYSTWKGPAIHLEDLIVKESHRGRGIGTLLLDEVVKYAKERGVRRLGWEVLDWNVNAIKFYESKGAVILKGWQVVQMDKKAIEKYQFTT